MGLFNKKEEAKAGIKMVVKQALRKAFLSLVMIFIKLLPIILLAAISFTCLSWIVEIFTAKNTPEKIYEIAGGIEDLTELVEIKGNDKDGYYLGFVDDFEAIVEDIKVYMNHRTGVANLPESNDFIKKMIKAEVVTRFPDLGGKIPEGSDGFQGAVKVDRISPNKKKGEMKNTGAGEKTEVKEEKEDEPGVSNQEEIVKEWKKDQKVLFINNAYIYEQTESKIDPKKDTGDWNKIYDYSTDDYEKIKEGTVATYTGTYKVSTNPKTNAISIYVEVKTNDKICYVKSGNLTIETEGQEETTSTTSRAKAREASGSDTTSTTQNSGAQTAGTNSNQTYTISIAAGHNFNGNNGARYGNLIEEEMTLKVAEKVEQLFSIYNNIKVVQTGTTRDNKTGVGMRDRVPRAKAANPVLDVQIHFNSSPGATGVLTISTKGDDVSKQLAEIVVKHMSEKMGLKNRGVMDDQKWTIIDSSANTGFPAIITEGGFIDGPEGKWLNTDEGITKYAQGIVDGILEYLKVDHQGYGASTTKIDNVTEDIESKARKLVYVTPETMKKYIESGNEEALKVFTLDKKNNIVTATWSKDGDSLQLSENPAVDIDTALNKYVVPFEYLLYFYIDSGDKTFVEELADEIMKSEIIAAVQDNVTTTSTKITTQQRKESSGGDGYGWKDISTEGPTINETVSTSLNLIYADVWCAKFSQSESYAEELANLDTNEKIVKVKGTVTESTDTLLSGEQLIDHGATPTGNQDANGNATYIEYKIYERTSTKTKTISNQYANNEMKVSEEGNKFIKIYQKNNMERKLKDPDIHLFLIMENNDRTKNLVKLTKYLMYKATGISYYDNEENIKVVEYDFSEFKTTNMQNVFGTDADYGDWNGGSNEDFIKLVGAYAVTDMEQHHVYASVTIAQAIEESGWGTSEICKACKNYFGMKAFSEQKTNQYWTGDKKKMHAGDGWAYYRVYKGLKDSVYDHGVKLQTQSEYVKGKVEQAYNSKLGPKEQITRIQASGYMPEKSYVDRIWNIIQKYDLTKYDNMTSADFTPISGGESAGADNIEAVCKEVTETLLKRHAKYAPGTYGNIKKVYEKDNCVVCATYVALVLYRSGLMTEQQINKYNYHYTGEGGIPNMLKAAGWKKVSKSNLKPGDVINKPSYRAYGGGHAVMYVGHGTVWDETSATNKTKKGKSASRYINNSGFVAWRAPNR